MCDIFRLKILSNGSEAAIASECICMAIIVSQMQRAYPSCAPTSTSVLTSRSLVCVRFFDSQVEQLENAQARSLFADDALLLVESGLYADYCAPLLFLSFSSLCTLALWILLNLRHCIILVRIVRVLVHY